MIFPIDSLNMDGAGCKIKLIMFRPREWRGTGLDGECTTPFYCLTPEDFAGEINNYPLGSVAHTYVTSDGGANMTDM